MNIPELINEWKDIFVHSLSERERLVLLIDLGSELDKPAHLGEPIAGCVSKAWVQSTYSEGKVCFDGWAEALIIKGYIVLLKNLLDSQSPQDIVGSEELIQQFITEAQLNVSLIPSRTNSFERLYQAMREQARRFLAV